LVFGIDQQIAQRLVLLAHARADVRKTLDEMSAPVAAQRVRTHVLGITRAMRATKKVRQFVHNPSHVRPPADATIPAIEFDRPNGTKLATPAATKMHVWITTW